MAATATATATATAIATAAALVQAFGESSCSEDEAHEQASAAAAEARRRAVVEAFVDSSESEIDSHPSPSPQVLAGGENPVEAFQEAFGESWYSEDEAHPSSVPLLVRETEGFTVDSDCDAEIEAQSPNEAQRRALVEAFGDSSHSEDEAHASTVAKLWQRSRSPSWQSVEGIEGLWLCRDFLSENHQLLLIQAIQREGWFAEGSDNNQGMRFGDLPEWATELSRSIREAVCFAEACSGVTGEELTFEDSYVEEDCPLPVDILWREPLFDQLIINVYKPGEGICAHVDLMRFADGIAIVSLESTCVMHFTRCEQKADTAEVCVGEESPPIRIPVYLSPGSLVLLSGEARYHWKHEINRKPGFQLWEGKEILQQRRTSVTLRKLLQIPNQS